MQKLLYFILVVNFMLCGNLYQKLLRSEMLDCNKAEFRGSFTDSGGSLLVDLELHVLSF